MEKKQHSFTGKKAIKLGFRGIDTACQPKHYNEANVGEALHDLKQEGLTRGYIFTNNYTTQVKTPTISLTIQILLEDQVNQSFSVSQHNLQTNYVDSLLLHAPLKTHNETMQVWQAMEKLHETYKAKHLRLAIVTT